MKVPHQVRNMNNSACGELLSTSSSTTIANIVFNGCLCYSTTMLNILTIHALRKTSALSSTLKTLLLSLAVSDLGIGLLGQPLYIAVLAEMLRCNSTHLPILVGLAKLVQNILFLSSFFSIMALSVDRFLAVQKPLRYEEIVTKKRVSILIITIWLFSVFLVLCAAVLVIPQHFVSVLFLIIESLCFVVTTWVSYKIYLTARHHNMQIQAQVQQVSQNNMVIANRRKSAQITLFIYVVFWACYLPQFVILIAQLFAQARQSTTVYELFVFSHTLVLLNSSLNPVIYCWKMRPIRCTIINILQNIFRS